MGRTGTAFAFYILHFFEARVIVDSLFELQLSVCGWAGSVASRDLQGQMRVLCRSHLDPQVEHV